MSATATPEAQAAEYLTLQETADLARCHRETVVLAIQAGDLKAGRLGTAKAARYRIHRDDVRAWLTGEAA